MTLVLEQELPDLADFDIAEMPVYVPMLLLAGDPDDDGSESHICRGHRLAARYG